MSIKENLLQIKSQLPNHVTLVAVSKTKPVADLMEAYNAGQRIFGENYVQELVEKHEALPKDIQWHFIGHLQSRKVKLIAPFINLIHGVDSLKLLYEINKEAQKNNRIIDCLLQIYIAEEESKFGLDEKELTEILSSEEFKNLKNIRVIGLMGMATFTENHNLIKKEFQNLKTIFDNFKKVGLQSDSSKENLISELPKVELYSDSLEENLISELPKVELYSDSLEENLISELPNVGLQSDSSEENLISELSKIKLLTNSKTKNIDMKIISMGMSGDYKLAIECGSTMVRIGSSIFGTRN